MAAKKSSVTAAPKRNRSRNEEVEFINFEGILESKTVSTTCKVFGSCIYEGVDLGGDCAKCKQSPEVKEACQIMTGAFLPVTKIDVEKESKKRSAPANGYVQNRCTVKGTDKNSWGHKIGSIGAEIDRLIFTGLYTKEEIEVMAGTKMSKVNSHIAHLRKEKGAVVNVVAKVVSFGA